MPTHPLHSVTVIFSPYHVGIRDHAVGAGPGRIREKGLLSKLRELGVAVHEVEIEPVDDFDGDTFRAVYTVRFAGAVYVFTPSRRSRTAALRRRAMRSR